MSPPPTRPLVGLVGAELLPDERRAVLERRLGIHDGRLRVVLDDHVLGGVDRGVPVVAATTTATGSPTCLTSPRLSGQWSGVLISTPGGAQTIGSGPAKSPAMSSPVSTATTPARSCAAEVSIEVIVGVRLGERTIDRVQHAGEVDVLGVAPPAR